MRSKGMFKDWEWEKGKRKWQIKAECPTCKKIKWCDTFISGCVHHLCPSCHKIIQNFEKCLEENKQHWKMVRQMRKGFYQEREFVCDKCSNKVKYNDLKHLPFDIGKQGYDCWNVRCDGTMKEKRWDK